MKKIEFNLWKTQRLFLLLCMLLVCLGHANAYYIYLYTGDFTDWSNDYATFKVGTSGDASGDHLTYVAPNWYRGSTTKTGTQYIKRCSSGDGSTYWNGQFSASISSTNYVVKATGWNAGSVYSQSPMYVAGNQWKNTSNADVLASWSTTDSKGKMTYDKNVTFSKTFSNVKAGDHEFKIVFYNTWDNAIGWGGTITGVNCTTANSSGNIKFTQHIAGNVTIAYNASTGAITITCPAIPITLDKNGGDEAGSATVNVGASSLTSITHATRANWNLTGYWTNTSGGYKVINNDGSFVAYSSNVSDYLNNATPSTWKKTSATTLYAQWNQSFTVTYDANGGTGTMTDSNSPYNSGATVTVKNNGFTRTGYTFTGWNTEEGGGGTDYAAGATFTISANTTLYAQWSENKTSVTLAASPAGAGTFTIGGVAATSTSAGVTTKPSVTAVPQPGYRVNTSATVWTKDNNNITLSNDKANPTTVTGCGTASTSSTLTAKFTRTYAFVEGRFHVTNANRDGTWINTFSSGDWSTSSTSIQFDYDDTNHRFYRHTYATPAELTSEISGQTPYFHIRISNSSSSISGGNSYYPASNTALTTAGSKTTLGTTGTNNLYFNSTDNSGYAVLYFDQAKAWYELEQTLEYNGNGNTGGSAPAGTVYYDKGTNATAASNTYTKTGYTFSGWNTKANGTGTSYAAGATNVTMNSNITLYAQWTANQYTISFSQSGEGYGSGGQTANKTATYDAAMPTTISLPTAATGYAFMGYYDALEPLGTQYYDASGNSAHKWDKTSNTTLYAYFKKAEITGYTFSTGSTVVAPNTNITVTATLSPTPQPTTHIDWRILHSNDNPLDNQPSFGTGITTNTFATPTTSGMYKMEATLRTGSTANAGTVLSTYTASFQVAGDHTVTLQYKCGDETIKASTTMTGKPLVWTSVTAPDIFGYTFSKWIPGDGISIRDGSTEDTVGVATTATIQIKAIYDGKLTAVYTQKSYIYFKNTLGWSSVYVNFLGDWGYWNNPKGSGNKDVTNRNKLMTQIEGTNIWYYDYGTASITPTLYVSFTEDLQNGNGSGAENFWKTGTGENVVYPANYPDDIHTDKSSENGFKAATPMFVPISQDPVVLNSSGGGKANYYNAGYWTKYTPGTGYTLEIYNNAGNVLLKSIEFTSEDELMPMKAVVDLEAGQTYKYQLRRGGTGDNGIYYGNSGTMTYANHGSPTPWDMTNSSFSMCGITTNAAGDYTFNLCYAGHATVNPHYRLRMAVDYPIANNDYRVIYKHTGQTNWKASAIVPKVNNGKDTVSFFIKPGATPYMKIQQASVNSTTGAVTWSDYYSVPTATLTALSGDTVYNACITMDASGGASVDKIEPYTGNYYIRTDCANSKWDNYRGDPDHLMTYSEYSIEHGGYSHYYCHWVQTDDRKNIKFTIANDYNPGLSDTLTRETASGTWQYIGDFIESNGDIKRNANVRFMWNHSTNVISRAYVDGAQEDGSRFLVISSTDGKIKTAAGGDLPNNEVTFKDNENWIYEANVKALPTSQYKLISTWGKTGETDHLIDQYFKGSSSSTETLIDGSGTDWYDIRLVYDFKTNRLVAAWIPSDATITSDNAINADVMFIREHQGDIAQLTFGSSGKISKIETAYGVMRFNKYTLANKDKSTHNPLGSPASVYERSLFWISFPFRVKLSEVFGFGTYGTHWAIQYYDGADRAARGHFQENGSFWKWMNRSTAYLEPNQGYLLAIDLDLLGESSDVWGPESKSSQIELYFPSYGTMPDITNADVAQTIPDHECTINWYESGKVPGPDTKDPRTSYNRTIFDSHWNVISVPTYVNTDDVTFANTTWTAKEKVGPKFLYTWNADDNTITATTASGYTYHAMHAYMTQYYGGITWSASSGSPASIVARSTYEEAPKEIEFDLELRQNEKTIDRTFVVMSTDEEASAGFKFGEDMIKEFNASKAAIYTFIPNEAVVAGNTLPMSDQTTIVPVGVDIKTEGEYVFSLPEGTSGVGVTLVDKEKNLRTNLALSDYAVTLPAGTYDERFVIEISPIEQIVTGVEMINGENGDASLNGEKVTGVCKKLIDGVLYIVKDGKVFDARGARIQ